MKLAKFSAGLAVAAIIVTASQARAADIDPPPVDGLRPATYDWTGPYVGAIGSGIDTKAHYGSSCVTCGTYRREHNGWGYAGGVLAGYNYQWNSFVLGVDGNWQWGGKAAENRHPSERTKLHYKDIATIKAKLGWAMDDTLLYATGGYARVKTRFSTSDFPGGSGQSASDSKWVNGWVVGGGVEHAFTNHIIGRLEYNYIDLKNSHYKLSNAGHKMPIDHKNNGIHMMSVGLAYNFGTW